MAASHVVAVISLWFEDVGKLSWGWNIHWHVVDLLGMKKYQRKSIPVIDVSAENLHTFLLTFWPFFVKCFQDTKKVCTSTRSNRNCYDVFWILLWDFYYLTPWCVYFGEIQSKFTIKRFHHFSEKHNWRTFDVRISRCFRQFIVNSGDKSNQIKRPLSVWWRWWDVWKNSTVMWSESLGKWSDQPEDITFAAVISSCEKGQYLESLRNARKKKWEPVVSWGLQRISQLTQQNLSDVFFCWDLRWKVTNPETDFGDENACWGDWMFRREFWWGKMGSSKTPSMTGSSSEKLRISRRFKCFSQTKRYSRIIQPPWN